MKAEPENEAFKQEIRSLRLHKNGLTQLLQSREGKEESEKKRAKLSKLYPAIEMRQHPQTN